jgi:cyclopropane fatty-acyl-phospholipid synthase-like methyltransferase
MTHTALREADLSPGAPEVQDAPLALDARPAEIRDLQRVLETVNERHRSVYNALADEYEKKSSRHFHTTQDRVERVLSYIGGSTVLDVGCGVGLALSMLAARGLQASGVDISPRMAELARERVAAGDSERGSHTGVVVGDFLTADLGTYDAIWEQALLHLFPSVLEHRIFDRFRALLNPGGILSLSTTVSPVSWEDWETKTDYGAAPARYRRSMTEDELIRVLQSYGFSLLDKWMTIDPYRKTWLTVIGEKQS